MRLTAPLQAAALLLSGSLAAAASSSSSPPVSVSLVSPWAAPPLVLELLEAAHTQDPDGFWTLLTHLTGPWAFNDSRGSTATAPRSAQAYHTAATRLLDQHGLLGAPGEREMWNLALALHTEAPKIAAFWQLYEHSGPARQWATAAVGREAQCASWVAWGDEVLCTEQELVRALTAGVAPSSPHTVAFDHIFSHPDAAESSTLDEQPTAVLYADVTSANFWSLHTTLLEHVLGSRVVAEGGADVPPLRYVLRWRPSAQGTEGPKATMAGYGATLDLKKVDYLVIDDRKLQEDSSAVRDVREDGAVSSDDQLSDRAWLDAQIGAQPEDAEQALSSLTKEELADLDVLATQVIATSSDPLRALEQLVKDFPLHAVALARRAPKPDAALLSELAELQSQTMDPGSSDIWLNGKALTEKEITPLGIIPALRADHAHVASLTSPLLNMSNEAALDLLSYAPIGVAQDLTAAGSLLFDASDRIERAAAGAQAGAPGVLSWFNDLEKDSHYESWSPSLQALIRPLWPGAFPHIARNLFNVVLVMDLGQPGTCRFLAESVIPTIPRIGLRWGLVPGGLEGKDETSLQLARMFWYLSENWGVEVVAKWLRRLARSRIEGGRISLDTAREELQAQLHNAVPAEDFPALFEALSSGEYPGLASRERMTRSYVRRLHLELDESMRGGHVMLNGESIPLTNNLINAMHAAVTAQSRVLAPLVYYRKIDSENTPDVSHFFYDLPTTFKTRSALVFADTGAAPAGNKPRAVDLVRLSAKATFKAPLETFVYPEAGARVNATLWVVGDLDSVAGAHLVYEAAKGLSKASYRLGLIHVPQTRGQGGPLSAFLAQLLASGQADAVSGPQLAEGVKAVAGAKLRAKADEQSPEPSTVPHWLSERGWATPGADSANGFWSEAPALARALGVKSGQIGLVVNGRVLTDFDPNATFAEDITTLVAFESVRRINAVVEGLEEAGVEVAKMEPAAHATTVMLATSVMSHAYFVDESAEGIFTPPQTGRNSVIDSVFAARATFEVGKRSTARTRLSVVLDPLSERTQSWAPVLRMLAELPDTHIRVLLNPRPKLRELPLKRFYRFAAPAQPAFDLTGQQTGATLEFHGLPGAAVLTLGLDTPPSWLCMSDEAVYDLDNIRLADIPAHARTAGVRAQYALKHILLEAHVRDADQAGQSGIPRGLELILESPDGAVELDTIVMANLGYAQFLPPSPGLYRLRIRDGRSKELYEMRSVGNLGWESPSVEVTGTDITLTSLHGLTIYPQVRRREGQENESLIEDLDLGAVPEPEAERGAAGYLRIAKNFFGGLKQQAERVKPVRPASDGANADINIFTVASGHLYERMASIMVLSVLKHTQSSVKFWFIENELSPSFKAFLPHLAAEYGFRYELITYAWPHWLRSQREKQRRIWGYKILFLDVLFPLDLKKVIFVDADQIVRVDLQELVDTNLQGAPYGYPPMGDDRPEVEGFRFWKQGYWKTFLRGKPYHISALYVVDLARFRRVAAGDQLRGQYQQLSSDPGSLANLDQDLPNNMQFQLPIHTLDKSWLWCETWCSDASLAAAKTIDLCQNPAVKSTKLERARKIPEWTAYDDEVARLAQRLASQQLLADNIAASNETVALPVPESELQPEPEPALDAEPAPRHDEL